MNFGEKIAFLRTKYGMTREVLAEKMKTTHQSVLEWEQGISLPRIDKLKELCDLLSISADSMISDEISIEENFAQNIKNKYFGTDGFRGEANIDLTSEHAYKVGRFLGWYYGRQKSKGSPRILIGKDTRRSSYMLEYSVAAGITASGADAYMLHVTTTPSVSYVTRIDNFDCGIMITASHNPFYDNGIKIINKYGEKLEDDVVTKIEAYLDGDMETINVKTKDIPLATKDNIGRIVDYAAGRNRYVGYLISIASHSYNNLKIGLDCANGASWSIAKGVFQALGAQTYVIGDEPDGLNINEGVGSTNIEKLSEFVTKNKLDVGFAFDGDGDRCICVDENGDVIDGDKIIYILANRLKTRCNLHNDTVVITVMSNIGLTKALKQKGIDCELTAVGDRFVYQRMQEGGYTLGGEQSGHIIIRKYATTGDAILTAIMLTEEIKDKKCKISKLCEEVTLFPQVTESIKVRDKNAVLDDVIISEAVNRIESDLGADGRIIIRPSGTEPVIRIMIESSSRDTCFKHIDYLQKLIKERGHLYECSN